VEIPHEHPFLNQEVKTLVFAAVGVFALVMITCVLCTCYCCKRQRTKGKLSAQSARIEMMDQIDILNCESARTSDGGQSGHDMSHLTNGGTDPGMDANELLYTPRGITADSQPSHVIAIADEDAIPVLPGSKTHTPELIGDGPLESVDDDCYHEGLYVTQGMDGDDGGTAGDMGSDESERDQSFDALYGRHKDTERSGVTDDNVRTSGGN